MPGFDDNFFQYALQRAKCPIGDFLQSAAPSTGHVDFGWEPVRRTGVDFGPAPQVGQVDLSTQGYAAPRTGVDWGVGDFLRPLQLIQQGMAQAQAGVAAAKKAQERGQAPSAQPAQPGQPTSQQLSRSVTGGVLPSQGLEGITLSGLGPGQRQEFLLRAMALGQVLEQETGIPAEVFAAMAANESNFGNAPGNIVGGVKALPGEPYVELDTTEVINGVRVPVRDRFRASATALEGMRHVAQTLQSGRYAQAYQQLQRGEISPETFIWNVNRAGYATNPNWATGEIIPLMNEARQSREGATALRDTIQAQQARREEVVTAATNPVGQDVIGAARQWTGTPYRLGGNGQGGIDCSALILRTAEAVGKPLQGVRTAQQIHNVTQRVAEGDVQPGDLVFFRGTYAGNPGEVDTHVGIVTGPNTMISAAGSGVGTQNFRDGYWGPKITGFTRLP